MTQTASWVRLHPDTTELSGGATSVRLGLPSLYAAVASLLDPAAVRGQEV